MTERWDPQVEKTLYFPPVDEMPIMEEIRIREKDPSQGNNTQQASYKIQQDIINKGVGAGELENLSKFTEKVGDFCLFAEGHPQNQALQQRICQADQPIKQKQETTKARIHDDHVV